MGFRVEQVREDFPILNKDKPPIYFDNACMTLRPQQVISKITEYYEQYPACAGRSIHRLSQKVDEEVYKARRLVKKFLNAKQEKEIIFQRNATEAINLVAHSFPFKKGDVVLVGDKEHNSNLLPWQVIAEKKELQLDVIDSDENNTFSLENFKQKIEQHDNVRMVALGMTANLDGVSIPAKEITKIAHKAGAKVLLDAAQTVPHHVVDVKSLGADFLAFSGHKMLGPTGIGVLYGQEKELDTLSLYNVGGETAEDTWYDRAKWEGLPYKFEAGLQHYSGILGLGTATEYLKKIGLSAIEKHELSLNKQVYEGLVDIKGTSFIGPQDPKKRGGITSFNIKGLSPHDIATMISASQDVMIRSGAHCVHSWFNKHNLTGSARASLYLYNTEEEVASFINAVKDVAKLGK